MLEESWLICRSVALLSAVRLVCPWLNSSGTTLAFLSCMHSMFSLGANQQASQVYFFLWSWSIIKGDIVGQKFSSTPPAASVPEMFHWELLLVVMRSAAMLPERFLKRALAVSLQDLFLLHQWRKFSDLLSYSCISYTPFKRSQSSALAA